MDGVTPGHGAGLPCSLLRVGLVFSFFFSFPFSILSVWKQGAEQSPAPPVSQEQGVTPGFELSVPGAVSARVCPSVLTRVGLSPCLLQRWALGGINPASTHFCAASFGILYPVWLFCLNLQLLGTGE